MCAGARARGACAESCAPSLKADHPDRSSRRCAHPDKSSHRCAPRRFVAQVRALACSGPEWTLWSLVNQAARRAE
eukprot:8980563-Alexandrium_andersonii.AAC.1